jgi:iron complex transport system substrate-binding protein
MAALVPPSLSHAESVKITDDRGTPVALSEPAMRIIALYGAYNEILAAMGLESRLIARTKADELPPSIASKPVIGTHMRPNIEIILGLRPDLIIQEGARREAMAPVNQLREQGLNVAVFNPSSFADLFSVIDRLGALTGQPEAANRLNASMRERLDKVKRKLDGVSRRPTVFFEVRYPNLLAAGEKSMVGDIISHAGGVNCVKADKKLVRLGMEALIACKPDYYVTQRGPMNPDPGNPSDRSDFSALDAVRLGRILTVDEREFSRPGPRAVDAVEKLARFLHPDLWKETEPRPAGN